MLTHIILLKTNPIGKLMVGLKLHAMLKLQVFWITKKQRSYLIKFQTSGLGIKEGFLQFLVQIKWEQSFVIQNCDFAIVGLKTLNNIYIISIEIEILVLRIKELRCIKQNDRSSKLAG